MTYSADQVLAMAPDAAAAKAGLGQASPGGWSGCGRNEQALWGECQGSGRMTYRTQAAFDDGATKCSCPSRKSPCKHALGLLLLDADGAIQPASPPGWVCEWLAARAARSALAASRARRDRPEGPREPQAADRRP